jgi:hypothetical protein
MDHKRKVVSIFQTYSSLYFKYKNITLFYYKFLNSDINIFSTVREENMWLYRHSTWNGAGVVSQN